MKRFSIKILTLLALALLFMSSCALEYQERNRRSRNWDRNDRRYRDRDRDGYRDRDRDYHDRYYRNYNK